MRRIAQLVAGIVLLAGCGERTATGTAPDAGQPSASRQSESDEGRGGGDEDRNDVARDLATVRRVTASFHDIERAKRAGWFTKITDCMTSPAGGMGFHFGNADLIDGSVRVNEPEVLLYEPQSNGRMRLVAVEYIIPVALWTSPRPPRLFGRDLHVIPEFQVWAIHAWVWDHNPSGMFADWNPRVTCAHAPATSAMSGM